MFRGLFVTGTDTGVGKTIVCASLMHRYRYEAPLRYWKPIQTGVEQDDDTDTVRVLGACATVEVFDGGVRLPQPLSPHLAARLAGTSIEVRALLQQEPEDASNRRWIVEGAGGVLVPLSGSEMMIDLMTAMRMPVLVVARSTLGTINHTLLTLGALRRRDLEIAGVVMVGEPNAENREAVERFGHVHVLGEMPRFETLTSSTLADWSGAKLDRKGHLLQWLR